MTPQHTLYVGHSPYAFPFDRGCHVMWLTLWLQARSPRDRKRKGKVVSSSSQVPKFKTSYHEAHYKVKLSARKVLPKLIISINDEILSPCALQIKARKWERFTNPIQAVGHHMVK
ncbi:hypothetical protein PIB30_078905 [Stylosanthes scabra]|uniref:Uncharacterized protein n=1 Tax=Stylosanthes scabra TaxID=79078 RepID=A0ABU6XPB9_9FABA|nr:hypothetical protein [Stylosanthes scabra]